MADSFKSKVITPNKIFHEGDAIMVELTMMERQVDVYTNRILLTAIISPGILKIREEGQVGKASLISDFMKILPKQVVIMVEVAKWPEEIDANRAEEARMRTERRLRESSAETGTLHAEMALEGALTRLEARQRAKKTL